MNLVHVKGKTEESGKGPSFGTIVWRPLCSRENLSCVLCFNIRYSPRPLVLQARLSSLHTTRLHASAKGSSSGHLKGSREFEEDQDCKCHCHKKASRTPSADSSCTEKRSNSIQEFAESFEKQLHFKSKRSVSLVGKDK